LRHTLDGRRRPRAVVARLRALAARLDELPLDAAADVLVLVEPALRSFEQHMVLALERAPPGSLNPPPRATRYTVPPTDARTAHAVEVLATRLAAVPI
jgi:hypothetical protein